jgi:hypothetical protein
VGPGAGVFELEQADPVVVGVDEPGGQREAEVGDAVDGAQPGQLPDRDAAGPRVNRVQARRSARSSRSACGMSMQNGRISVGLSVSRTLIATSVRTWAGGAGATGLHAGRLRLRTRSGERVHARLVRQLMTHLRNGDQLHAVEIGIALGEGVAELGCRLAEPRDVVLFADYQQDRRLGSARGDLGCTGDDGTGRPPTTPHGPRTQVEPTTELVKAASNSSAAWSVTGPCRLSTASSHPSHSNSSAPPGGIREPLRGRPR